MLKHSAGTYAETGLEHMLKAHVKLEHMLKHSAGTYAETVLEHMLKQCCNLC
jgi:hypothetical protein